MWPSACRKPRNPSSGIALVMVLWLLVLLSIIALHLATVTRGEARLSNNLVMGAKVRYAADAGVQWAIWNLSLTEGGWLADGGPQKMELGETEVNVSLQDENGKFNINAVTAAQLLGLFAAAGVDEATASMLSDRILDWRDKDDLTRLEGAEDEDYLAAGLDYEAADSLFRSVEELRLILGMEEWIYQRISPALSTRARNQGVNPLVAPRLVLLSFPGATEELVDQYIEQRRSDHLLGYPARPPVIPAADFIPVTTRGVYYTVVTEAEFGDEASSRKRVLLARTAAGQNSSYRILDVSDVFDSPTPACDGEACSEEG